MARGAAVGVMGMEFMEAGRAVGLKNRTLIWRYLTLNCISTVAVFLTLRFGQVILVGSSLGFLGMGAQPPVAVTGPAAETLAVGAAPADEVVDAIIAEVFSLTAGDAVMRLLRPPVHPARVAIRLHRHG